MSRVAETRSRRRRRPSSNYLAGGGLLVALALAGIYCVAGDEPFSVAWNQLGFGPKSAPQTEDAAQSVADRQSPNDELLVTESKVTGVAGNESKPTAVPPDDDLPPVQFLPQDGLRQEARVRNPRVAESVDNANLDRRFDSDALAEHTATVDAAVFADAEFRDPEPITPKPQRRTDRPRDIVISDDFDVKRPPISGSSARTPQSAIQRIAGEEPQSAPSRGKTGRIPVQASPTTNVGPPRLNLNEIDALVSDGRDAEAYQKLSEAYFQYPTQRPMFQARLDEVAGRIYFSPQTQIEPPYEIQPGDQLRKIASKYRLSWQYLSNLNQVDARKIRPGKMLKVFQGPFKAKVDLSDFQLTVLLNGQYVKSYLVGIGKLNSTPIGEFTVREKLENPTYFGPNGMVMEPDDPQNPLGERWIDIGNSFGIHGTIEPESIGKSESAGCIRMKNEDVAEVYDLLTIGSTVRIQR